MGSHRSRLARITDTILDLGTGPSELRDATAALHSLCSAIVGLEPDTDGGEADRETVLDQGRALSPRDAARCILDFARTSAFLRGVHDAITTLLSRDPDRKVNVLYAGCGPFAPIALPLTTRFASHRLAFTLLDAHEYSIASVRRLVKVFDVSSWCSEIRCCNALEYVHPDQNPVHLLIVEAMQKALENEPQVALTRHLTPQLASGGILVPERVRLALCLADMSAEFSLQDSDPPAGGVEVAPKRRRLELGTLMELSRDRTDIEPLLITALEIPDMVHEMPDLLVRTTVDVFGGHRLDDYDSGISYPTMVHHLGRLRPGDRLSVDYEMGPSPGLRIRRATTP